MKWVIVITLCMLLSCSRGGENSYSTYILFPNEKLMSAKVINLDTVVFRYPFRVSVMDSVALVLDLHNVDNYFHAFSYPDFKHIASFGKRGQGPDEMLSAETIRFESLDSIWTVDANKMEISRFSLSPSARTVERKEIIPINRNVVRALDVACYSESTFIIPDYTGDNRFCMVNNSGEIVKKQGTIPTPKKYKELSMPAVAQAWRSFVDYNPRNGILALVTQLGEVFEVYHLNDTVHHVRYGPNGAPQFRISEGYGIPAGIMGFSDVQVTDNYIYAVFHGRTFWDISRQKDDHTSGGKFIYVFNFDGEPVCKYILDHYIYAISVNEEKGIITAVDVNSDEPILEFKM